MEPAIRWAAVAFRPLQICLKPLVPTFPCFVNIVASQSNGEEPHFDFGLELLGGDIMAIPGLYQLVHGNSRLISISSGVICIEAKSVQMQKTSGKIANKYITMAICYN
nr:synaptotagmin-3 isoform X1 [Ipomoea batatas]GMC82584.1 synaptotagmin-3 isoform X1 [Ipomoea batatas]GMC89484.1 synaptotagmin-3 isoform X1 [Ipomoea batatas]